jgi:iron(III) transport system ATP-binding protein
MSNRIAVMRDGKIEQVGRPRDVYERPVSRFVADFIGISNFIDGTIEQGSPDDGYDVRTAQGPLRARSSVRLDRGASVVLSIRPEHVGVRAGAPASGEERAWRGTVQARAFLGESVDHVIDVGGTEVRARCNPSLSIPPGTEVTLTLDESVCTLIPADA